MNENSPSEKTNTNLSKGIGDGTVIKAALLDGHVVLAVRVLGIRVGPSHSAHDVLCYFF